MFVDEDIKINKKSGSRNEILESLLKTVSTESGAQICWPIYPKNKKDSHIRLRGCPDNVAKAKSMLLQVLESQQSRVILKMDVPYVEHPHLIGRGGNLIKQIMEYTNCHIHFPDCNTSEQCEKSNQVSISGEPLNVEKARLIIRTLLPVVISFDIPSGEISKAEIILMQRLFNISIYLKHKLDITTVSVRCSQNYFHYHKQGILSLMDYVTGRENELPVTLKTQILQPQRGFVLGSKRVNIVNLSFATNTKITFPERNSTDLDKDSVTITGSLDNVFSAYQELMNYLPLMVIFDVQENYEVSADYTKLFEAYQLNIYTKLKPRSNSNANPNVKTITVKAPEKYSKQLLQFRQHIFKLPELNFLPNLHEIALASSLFYSTLENSKYFVPSLNFTWTRDSFWNLRQQLQLNLLVPSTEGTKNVNNQYSWKSSVPSRVTSPASDSILPETDYFHKKALATQAMHRTIESLQVPTDVWAGCGFSQSMPAAVIKEKMKRQDKFDQFYSPNTCPSKEMWSSENFDNSGCFEKNIWSSNRGSSFSYSNYFDAGYVGLFDNNVDNDLLPTLLCKAGLDKYIDIFNKEEIDYSTFLLLSHDDLKNLGVPYGSRTKMISLIRQLQKRDWEQHYDTKKTFEAAPGAERKLIT